MEIVKIKTLSEYMEFVEDLDKNFCLSRGQTKEYSLLPSGLRLDENKKRKYSKKLLCYYLDEFKINSYNYIEKPGDIINDIEWMIYAQHYGLPTYLLDFSRAHIISLMFSVEDAFRLVNDENISNSEVYFLNPYELNRKFAKYSDVITTFDKIPLSVDGPIAIQARKMNHRINAQNGLFVKFEDGDEPLETISDDGILKKIIIEPDNKRKILTSIFNMGIGFSHLYPELSYVVKDIMAKRNIIEFQEEEY